jgi:DNA helicase-2/ATP-dependent DNA helicase PcrA
MSTFTAGLNPEQRKAVETTEGPLLVLAGAGTGKTRVITHRIAHLLEKGVPASSVLAMTFTNRAAGEMKSRIAGLVHRGSVGSLTVGTFHSLCVKALRRYAKQAGIRPGFGICDADDQLVAIKQALRELQIPESSLNPRVCLSRISLLKNRLPGPEALVASSDEWESNLGRVYQRYDTALRVSGLLDFDDLLLYMVRLLKDKKILALFRERYRYVLVDEYQDTNGPQYSIVKSISGTHRNVCVVGDDDQSIYGWRGADVSKILNFESDFPKATVVRLETNYRSTPQILEGANAVIRNNSSRHEKALRAAAGDGDAIISKRLPDEEAEAQFVVEDILDRVRTEQIPLSDFSILFRTAIQPRVFEVQLRQYGIPYNLVGGMSFFDRKEVRDILAYLKLVANPDDELSLLRVINTPPRGIGTSSIEKMLAVAAQQSLPLAAVIHRNEQYPDLPQAPVQSACRFLDSIDGLSDLQSGPDLVTLVRELVNVVDYDAEIRKRYADEEVRIKRREAVAEIMNMAEAHVRRGAKVNLTSFLEDIALTANDDSESDQEGSEQVTLMTLHSAKGLEFSQVYLAGVEEGLLPHGRSVQDGDIEEERRLAYVGITRARHRLTVTYVQSRAKYGRREGVMPSRFLYEMHGEEAPGEILDHSLKAESQVPEEEAAKKKTKKTAKKRARRKTRKRRAAAT